MPRRFRQIDQKESKIKKQQKELTEGSSKSQKEPEKKSFLSDTAKKVLKYSKYATPLGSGIAAGEYLKKKYDRYKTKKANERAAETVELKKGGLVKKRKCAQLTGWGKARRGA